MKNAEMADLMSAVQELEEKVRETNRHARVGNVLALGEQMGLDMTKPQDVAKAARHLTVVERNSGVEAHA